MEFDVKKDARKLDRHELAQVMKVVQETPPGIYTVRQMFGERWEGEPRKRAFGRWFKASVEPGDVSDVRWLSQRADRSHEYEVDRLQDLWDRS